MKRDVSVVGIDLAKRMFHVVGMDATGQILFRKRLSRDALIPFIMQLPPVIIGMEACGGAHYWARRFREHGHTVKLMAPQFVKPYVKSPKNDTRDAEAIGEAVTRPTMRFVPIKELTQQDLPHSIGFSPDFRFKPPSLISTAPQRDDSCGFQPEDGLPEDRPQW